MKIIPIANIKSGQDGAIYGKYLFRFNSKGLCRVYDMAEITEPRGEVIDIEPIYEFTLDRADEIVPHSNAVVFGNEYYAEDDEFPLLYSNIYNNYAKSENKRCGGCCVYRLQRKGTEFFTTLVQYIEIGFSDDREYWRSPGDTSDIRPYGNFVIDPVNGIYYGFTMRDGVMQTRYFAFELPKLSDGEPDAVLGINKVTLNVSDIKEYFDAPYHNFIQGACLKNGKIYSVEGFHAEIHPAIRIIDTERREQVFFCDLFEAGAEIEAEFIDFYNEKCYYGDYRGHIFMLEFDE